MTDSHVKRTEQAVRLVALGLLIASCLLVLRPFLSALLWAVVLCYTTWPLYARLLRVVGDRRTVAAFAMTALTTLIILAPFAVIGISLSDDVQHVVESARQSMEEGPPEPPQWLGHVPLVGGSMRDFWRDLANRNAERIAQVRKWLEPVKSWMLDATLQFGRGLTEVGLSLLILFFLYRDGAKAAERLATASERVGGGPARSLLDVAGNTVRGVVYGIIGTALGQSVVAGIGFAIAGVPRAAFLALLTFFLSVVPFGPPLIWIPAAIWLFYQGSLAWGIFMALWGLLAISSIDNFIKPLIISRGSDLPFLLIFFGVIGGAVAFGLIGVFLGPTLIAVGFRVLTWWTETRAAGVAVAPDSDVR